MIIIINTRIITIQSSKAFQTDNVLEKSIDWSKINIQGELISNTTDRPLPNKEYIEYFAKDFENELKTDDLIEVSVLFQDNVIWNFPDLKYVYKYSNLNGFIAHIPTAMFDFLKKQSFIEVIEEQPEFDNIKATENDELDWGVDWLDSEEVWGGSEDAVDVLTGYPAGEGSKVALIDDGINYYHTDLNNNYKGGRDFAPINQVGEYDEDPLYMIGMPNNDHGHFLAGIIAAEDNGEDMIGIAPKASIYALKIYGKNWDYDLEEYVEYSNGDISIPIDWAIDNDIDIINMSFCCGTTTTAIRQMIELAYKQGITLIAAAGGNELGGNHTFYPAAIPQVIQVGATDEDNEITNYSNYGDNQDFVAPGGRPLKRIESLDLIGGTHKSYGTSIATAHDKKNGN
ncbi:MAG: S8 family serine peptidase [Candidatus Heimdallarchaeota archaeon]